MALPLPAGARSRTRSWSPSTATAPGSSRSTSCSTPACSTTTGTGRSPSTTPRPAPTTSASVCTARNAGPDEATLHVLPTLWFRNTWAWGTDDRMPLLAVDGGQLVTAHHDLGRFVLATDPAPELLFCDNETNASRLFDSANRSAYPKDAIGDHVVHGAPRSNPDQRGTKAAYHHVLTVRGRRDGGDPAAPGGRSGPPSTTRGRPRWRRAKPRPTTSTRALTPTAATADEAMILRQALAGMLWSKQFYHYDVEEWLEGDPAGPVPPATRLTGRNADVGAPQQPGHHLDARHVGVPVVRRRGTSPSTASRWPTSTRPSPRSSSCCCAGRGTCTRTVSCRPTSGRSATSTRRCTRSAALRVFEIDGSQDFDFLERILHKMLLNFTWWVNRKDADGNNVFEGGFLGLDNIGPDRPLRPPARQRSARAVRRHLVDGAVLPQPARDVGAAGGARPDVRRPRHQVLRALRLHRVGHVRARAVERGRQLLLRRVPGAGRRRRCRCGCGRWSASCRCAPRRRPGPGRIEHMPEFAYRMRWFIENKPQYAERVSRRNVMPGIEGYLLSIVGPNRLERMLERMLDTDEFLSPYGIRSLSKYHEHHPFTLQLDGVDATVDYEPAESAHRSVRRQLELAGPGLVPGELPPDPGADPLRPLPRRRLRGRASRPARATRRTLAQVADDLGDRLIDLFRADADGQPARPSGATPASRPTAGATSSCSSSTSTATPAPASAPPTRRAGPVWWPTSSCASTGRTYRHDGDITFDSLVGRGRRPPSLAPLVVDRIQAVRVPVAVIEILLGIAHRSRRPRLGRGRRAGAGAGPPRAGLRAVPRRLRARPAPAAGPAPAGRRARLRSACSAPPSSSASCSTGLRPGRQPGARRHPAVGHVAGARHARAARGRPAAHPPRPADDGLRVGVRVRRRGPAVAAVHARRPTSTSVRLALAAAFVGLIAVVGLVAARVSQARGRAAAVRAPPRRHVADPGARARSW